MSFIFMFGALEKGKKKPMLLLKKRNQNLHSSFFIPTIVRSQHGYFFVPTTKLQILI